jgi:hypothetical protein
MMKKRTFLVIFAALALTLAACGGDDDNGNDDSAAPTAESTAEAAESTGGLSLNTAPDLGGGPDLATGPGGAGDERQLPGCSDPDSEECPAPLDMPLDGEVSFEGVSVNYPSRYFVAAVGDEAGGDALIEITPSENYRFEEQASFQVYFAESVDAALAELVDPHMAEWNAGALEGTIGVMLDAEQDPQRNTTIGAFELPDGRAIVLQLDTTGKFGWDLFTRVYDGMLQTLTVAEAGS